MRLWFTLEGSCGALNSGSLPLTDVASQQSSKMTLAEWAAYYADPHRDKVKNVISLEVSESPLASQVEAPQLVR